MLPEGWIQLYTGRPFWPLNPRPEDFTDEDLAHGLAHECRFAGHPTEFHSVAYHSVLVADLLKEWGHPVEIQLAGLLHDAPEGLGLRDIPRPLKKMPFMDTYRKAEETVHTVVNVKYGLHPEAHKHIAVKRADAVMLASERQSLMNPCEYDWGLVEAPYLHVAPLEISASERLFLKKLRHLLAERT